MAVPEWGTLEKSLGTSENSFRSSRSMAHKMGFASCFESQSVILNIMGVVTGSLEGAELSTRVFLGVILG